MSLWAVLADVHFDEYVNYSTLMPSGVTSRLADMIACFTWVRETAVKKGCKGIIVIGDIFNSRMALELPVIDQVCRAFHYVHTANLQLIVVAGNHDSYLRSPRMNSLQVFRGYAKIIEKPTIIEGMAFVPWTDDLEQYRHDIVSITGKAKYLFTHVLLKGIVTGSNNGVPVDVLCHTKFKQVFLGDVHEPTEVFDNVRYVGSPLQIDYRDAGSKRGFCFFDDVKGTVEFVENTFSPRFHIIEDATTEDIHEDDFVRVKTDNAEIAAEAVAAAKKKTAWVESTFVETSEVQPRLDIRSSHTHEQILRRYCVHKGLEGCDDLVEAGLDVLEEAQNGS